MASPQAEECKHSATSDGRSTTSARRTPSKLQHLEVTTTAPARKTAFDHRDGLANYLRQPPWSQKSLLHGVPYRMAAFHKWEKMKPVFNFALYGVRPDSTKCWVGLFNHRQTAVDRGRRSVLRITKLAMYPDKRLAYYNSATRRQWTGEKQGRLPHRISTFLPVSVQALLQPSFTFYTNELHQQLPERHSRQQSGTGVGNVGTVEIDI